MNNHSAEFFKAVFCAGIILLFAGFPSQAQESFDDLKDVSFVSAQERLQQCMSKGLQAVNAEYRGEFKLADHLLRKGTCKGLMSDDNLPDLCYLRRAFMVNTFPTDQDFQNFLETAAPFVTPEHLLMAQANYYEDPHFCDKITTKREQAFCRLLFYSKVSQGIDELSLNGADAQEALGGAYFSHAFRFQNAALCDKIPSMSTRFVCRYVLSPDEDARGNAAKDFLEGSCMADLASVLAVSSVLDPEAPKDRNFCEEIPDKYGSNEDLYFECKELVLQADAFLKSGESSR